ncbi:MAG: transposase [Armatimonadota bacterium]|nr:transposase [bacterium]
MRRYKIFENGTLPHFITWTITAWLPLFVSSKYCDMIVQSLAYCRAKRELLVHGYVIMPTHVHAIVSANDSADLSSILRDSRKYTAREIVNQLKEDGNVLYDWVFRDAARKDGRPEGSYRVWQAGFHPETLESEKFVLQKLEYMHNNPLRKGLIEKQEHWRYSSAGLYLNGSGGLLELDAFEF